MEQMIKQAGRIVLLSIIVVTLQGCKKAKLSESEFFAYDSSVKAGQLALDIRIFDALCRGDTNMAKSVLASQIDGKLFQLEYNSKQRPLGGATKSLYDSALAYRNKSAELERLKRNRLTNAPAAQLTPEEVPR